MVNTIDGDIISLAEAGEFDVIAHGVNCFCTQKSGLAPQMVKAFGTDKFRGEIASRKGDINKLGNIDFEYFYLDDNKKLAVVNAYTQYRYGKNHADGDEAPLNYSAFSLCMKKINHIFAGKHIGLPKIGAGLAGGDWGRLLTIIMSELTDCKVTIINYKK